MRSPFLLLEIPHRLLRKLAEWGACVQNKMDGGVGVCKEMMRFAAAQWPFPFTVARPF